MRDGNVYVAMQTIPGYVGCWDCIFGKSQNHGHYSCPMGISECCDQIGKSWFIVRKLGFGELEELLAKEQPNIQMVELEESRVEVNGVKYMLALADWESDGCFYCKIPKDKDGQCIVGKKCSELTNEQGYWKSYE